MNRLDPQEDNLLQQVKAFMRNKHECFFTCREKDLYEKGLIMEMDFLFCRIVSGGSWNFNDH